MLNNPERVSQTGGNIILGYCFFYLLLKVIQNVDTDPLCTIGAFSAMLCTLFT